MSLARLILSWSIAVAIMLTGMMAMPANAAPRVSNTAQASWTDNGVARTLPSNTVDLDVQADQPPTLSTYIPDQNSPITTPIRSTGCQQGGGMPARSKIGTASAATTTAVTLTTSIHAGEPLIFKLIAHAANRDPNAIDTVVATLTTTSGDRETLTVYETGNDTGEFVGMIATRGGAAMPGNCILDVVTGDHLTIDLQVAGGTPVIADAVLDVLFDPQGIVFDSEDGTPVSGARVTLINVATGQPAKVFAPDGVTAWPSTVFSGQSVSDGAGATYPMGPGEYRFPFVAAGQYRLQIDPPSPYVAPSKTANAQLAGLARPDGAALHLDTGSRGEAFSVTNAAITLDVPVDRPAVAVGVTKTASRGTGEPGDQILYRIVMQNTDGVHAKRGVTVVDAIPDAMRLRADTVRLDGAAAASVVTVSADGKQLVVTLGALAAGATRTVTYALEIRPDAREGQAINRATVTDSRGTSSVASAAVRVTRETIAGRMTIIGRITDGPCTADTVGLKGVPGVRVMLEDGSYAITDRDGRYHFEGVVPGSHVVQVDPATLVKGGAFVDCTRSTRSAGSATSRFVSGQGGTLAVADFRAVLPTAAVVVEADPAIPTPVSDKIAAGAERNWFADGSASVSWLFPETDYNPRAPAIRVAIRHLKSQKIALFDNGKPVDPIAFDGTRNDPANTFTVSLWRGVPLVNGFNHLTAEVRETDGTLATTLTRDVHFATEAARIEYLPQRSRLIADGVARPVVAVRITDRDGHPVHAGSVGELGLSAPYETAQSIDADQARMLSGLERAAPTWRVAGDDGIAYVALAPTTTSGALTLDFAFRDRDQVRRQKVEAWLSPGNRAWTIVGLGEGRIGSGKLAEHVEALAMPGNDITADGRIAFYAKGRIKGSWLLTLAYDSAKKRQDQRLTGTIDPNTYYTVYADRSERRYDAASTRKLYLKLETRQFYALFGDFETNFTDTELGRYVRSATGVKAEYRGRHVAAAAFAAKFPTSHRRDEIQGSGLSVGYTLASHPILANSEQVTIEVRDRLRSEQIVDRRTLVRFIDYDIDYSTGAIRFSSPVLSRDSALNPQFIVVDYEVDAATGGEVNAGGRATWTNTGGTLKIGATALRDAGDNGKTLLGGVDGRVRIGTQTEIRGEIAASSQQGSGRIDAAWLIEAEQHSGALDVLAYARSLGTGYGIDQQNTAERGRRKIGVDARLRLSKALAVSASAWTDDDLAGEARRRALRTRIEYQAGATALRLGVAYAADRTDAVTSATSTLIEAGATRKLFGGRLELDAAASLAIGKAESVDFPAQYRLTSRFQLTPDVTLVGSYEIAKGDAVDARTARIGFDVKPWAGARLTSNLSDQDLSEYGRRVFAAYGLAQSFNLGKSWSLDATLDGNRTLSGIDASKIVNPAQPVASGGYVGAGDTITENFTAVTLGATYRSKLWSGTARAEYRFGQLGDRAGLTAGLIRQLGDGAVLGALGTWTRVDTKAGQSSETIDVQVSGALRPTNSPVAMLGKISYREDSVSGAVAGQAGPLNGVPLTVSGDVASRRLVGSLSLDWAPQGRDENGAYQRSELSLFVGTRYVFDRIDDQDLAGLTTLLGIDGRIGLGDRFEIGLAATLRGDIGRGSFGYAAGPTVGVRALKNTLITAGWNVVGFADRDFAAARTTQSGPFVSMKVKFDQNTFAFLGLTR